MNKGNIFVISAPSGAGKSSLVKSIQNLDPSIKVSISHTTRAKRVNEVEALDYYFIDKPTFDQMLARNEFLEHALVYGNYYGTSIKKIEEHLDQGHDIILEIDWQGALQVKKIFPKAVLIYILPPSIEELKSRLLKRNTDAPDVIETRLSQARLDISYADVFEYKVINDDFYVATHELYGIIQHCRVKN